MRLAREGMMFGLTMFLFLALLSSSAAAVPGKCVDEGGKVIYTDTPCPAGFTAMGVGGTVSVVSGERDATGGVMAATWARVKSAASWARVMVLRWWQVPVAIVILLLASALYKYIARRRQRNAEAAELAARLEYQRTISGPL